MPESKIGTPEDLVVLRNGNVLVPDTHYYRVVIFSPEGEILRTFGKHGTGDGEFLFPVSACEDASGNIYVCEYGSNDRVQKFTKDGEFITSFGGFGTGPGEFQRPAGMLWHDGSIYVADSTNHRIQVFSDDGEFQRVLGGAEKPIGMKFPYDIAMDDRGTVYAAEWGAGRVTAIAPDGRLIGRYARAPGSAESLRTPWGIAYHRNGRLLVADTGNRRIAELRL
jgi:sugar lactone lactonase YvrE